MLPVRVVPLLDPTAIVEANVDLVYREQETGYERRDLLTLQGGATGPLVTQALKIPTIAARPVGSPTQSPSSGRTVRSSSASRRSYLPTSR